MRIPMLVLSLAVTALAACGGDSSTTAPTQASIAGTWNLQTVNGAALPFIAAQTGSNKAEITGDVLTVTNSGSFTEITSERITTNGQVSNQSFADAGTYVLNGTAVSFRFNSDGSTGTGTISGNTLTVAEDGFSYVYKK